MFKYSHCIGKEQKNNQKNEKTHVWKNLWCFAADTRKKRPCPAALDWIVFKFIACLPHHTAIFPLLLIHSTEFLHFKNQGNSTHSKGLLNRRKNRKNRRNNTVLCIVWHVFFYWNRKHFITTFRQKHDIFIDFTLSHSRWLFNLLGMACWQWPTSYVAAAAKHKLKANDWNFIGHFRKWQTKALATS